MSVIIKQYITFQKHPLKPTQFNRPNPTAQWLNTFSNTKSKSNLRGAGGKPGNSLHHGLSQHQSQVPLHPNLQPPVGFPGGNNNPSNDEIMSNADADLLPWDQQNNLDPLANGNPNSSSGMLVSSCGTPTSTQALTTSAPPGPSGPTSSLLTDGSGLDVDSLVPGSPLGGHLGSNNVPLNPKGTGVPPNIQSPTSMGNLPIGSISPNIPMKPSLQGVKVPDENLTPQQLQHREQQLGKIKHLNQMFFPEHGGQNPNIPNNLGVPGGANCGPGGMPINHPAGMMGQQPGNPSQMMGMQMPHNPYNHPIQDGPNPNQQMMGMGPNPMMPCPMGQSKIPNQHMMGNANNAAMEWNKMQGQYFEEQRIKNEDGSFRFGGPGDCNMPFNMGSGMGSPGPMSAQRQMNQAQMRQNPANAMVGGYTRVPPPPYHQTQRSASVPIATQSPNPNSPNNPTSNLSLPSPRGGSALDSPAEPHARQQQTQQIQQQQQQQQFKHFAPGQSPTSMDSLAGMGNNMHRTINHSNPTTPLSSHLSPNASLKELDNSGLYNFNRLLNTKVHARTAQVGNSGLEQPYL